MKFIEQEIVSEPSACAGDALCPLVFLSKRWPSIYRSLRSSGIFFGYGGTTKMPPRDRGSGGGQPLGGPFGDESTDRR